MFHTVYQTTNLINQKIYIGVHSTKKLNDGYLGSGKALKAAIKKHGKENFERKILHFVATKEHAYELENKIVNELFVKNKNTYNVSIGGFGGYVTAGYTNEQKLQKNKNISNAKKGKSAPNKGIPMSEEQKNKLSIYRKGKSPSNKGIPMSEEQKNKLKGAGNGMYGKKHTLETIKNMSKKFKCPICNKEMNKGNLVRYHGLNGEKCKTLLQLQAAN